MQNNGLLFIYLFSEINYRNPTNKTELISSVSFSKKRHVTCITSGFHLELLFAKKHVCGEGRRGM